MSATFHKLRIADLKKETSDTVSIAFEVPGDLSNNFEFTPGQYLTLKTLIDGEDVRRSYSICSTATDNELRVAVKEVENGKFSTFANSKLSSGDELEVMTPEGNFVVNAGSANGSNYVFYAAGSGITPVMSMIRSILEKESDSNVYLYYGNKNSDGTIFKSAIDALNAANPNFHLTYFFSQEDSGDAMTNGRIDEIKCGHFYQKHLQDLKLEGVYGCGPQEMIETLKDYYTSKGLLHKFHFELFTATASPEASASSASEDVTSKVKAIIDDEEYEFELNTSGVSVLQAAQDKGADVPFSCKGGVCCTCRAKILEGSATMDMNFALEEEEVEQGFVLTCQAHPTSEKLVVSYDEY